MIGTVRFRVDNDPIAKQRARTHGVVKHIPGVGIVPVLNANGKQKHRSVTTPKNSIAEAEVQWAFAQACHGHAPHDGPVRLCVTAFLRIPRSWPKWKQAAALAGDVTPSSEARDVDNLAKTVLDGLNKVAYLDDHQVVELHVEKHYDVTPRLEVAITFDPVYERAMRA